MDKRKAYAKALSDDPGGYDPLAGVGGDVQPIPLGPSQPMALLGSGPGGPSGKATRSLAEALAGVPPPAPEPTGIRAFHGSPHDFEQFDMSKIGTGEGAQAYGHGLYFADKEGVARSYRDALVQSRNPKDSINTLIMHMARNSPESRTAEGVKWYMRQDPMLVSRANNPEVVSAIHRALSGQNADGTVTDAGLKAYRELDTLMPDSAGHMYEVNIRADPSHFLDWDKPLSEQSPTVQGTLAEKFGIRQPDSVGQLPNGRWAVMSGNSPVGRADGWPTKGDAEYALGIVKQDSAKTGGQIYESSKLVPGDYRNKVEAAQKLKDAGIPGIKYLDQGSRTAGDGSRNYVVFDHNLIDIVKKYGIAGAAAAGLISQQLAQILFSQGLDDQKQKL
jgi:hypothetical protein